MFPPTITWRRRLLRNGDNEYLAGAVYAMAGTTVAHGRIVDNISRAIGNQLRGKPCEVFSSEIKVRIQIRTADFYYYPDVIVDCGHDETPLRMTCVQSRNGPTSFSSTCVSSVAEPAFSSIG